MKRISTCLWAFLLLLASYGAFPPNPYDTSVRSGVWCGNFNAATNFSVRANLPLVLVWGQNGCPHCNELTNALATAEALAWASSKNAVFCLIEGDSSKGDLPPNEGALRFALAGKSGLYTPVIRFYWPKEVSPIAFSGWDRSMYWKPGSGEYPTILEQFERSVEKFLAELPVDPQPPQPPAGGGCGVTFPMGGDPNDPLSERSIHDRLEVLASKMYFAELDDVTVTIPLIRTNHLDTTTKTTLTYLYWGDFLDEISVVWNPGETVKEIESTGIGGLPVDEYVEIVLKDESGEEIARRAVWCVEDPANSADNPYWIGEKSAEELKWGEWSMDLDAVLGKVRSFKQKNAGEKAYAMVLVEGSRWCKDCAMTEANLIDRSEFRDWAERNHVVFAAVDIPSNPQAPNAVPSLLRYESYRTSDAYVSLDGSVTPDESKRWQSGAGYLSRHAIPLTGTNGRSAAEVAARFAELVGKNTLNGGWNRPERANQTRPPVPCFILLRDDGTIAGRWDPFGNVKGPSSFSTGYLNRLDEVLELFDEAEEESNNDKSTTRQMLSLGVTKNASVSAADRADVYLLSDVGPNVRRRFTLTGEAAELKMSVIDSSGTVLVVTNGLASQGLELICRFGSSESHFLKIEPFATADDTSRFGYKREASTRCTYEVTTEDAPGGGEIGFAVAVTNFFADAGIVKLPVVRRNGSSEAASVKVMLCDESTQGADGRYVWKDSEVSWAAGEMGIKTVELKLIGGSDETLKEPLHLVFKLVELTGIGDDLKLFGGDLLVNAYDSYVKGERIYRYVNVSNDYEIVQWMAGDEMSFSCVQGSLPAGLSITAKDGRLQVRGCCSAASGVYASIYRVSVNHGGVASHFDIQIDYTVVDCDFAGSIPSLAMTQTYGNLPVFDTDGVLKGVLVLTVPADGRISAKYMADGMAYAFSANGWASYDFATGQLQAAPVAITDGGLTMSVWLNAAGGTATVRKPSGEVLSFSIAEKVWPEGAVAYRGQYTVQMPQTNVVDGLAVGRMGGAAFLSLRMNDEDVDEGVMLYAGVLPNGRPVYGMPTLLDDRGERALLPFYHVSEIKSAPYSFSGCLAISKNAASEHEESPWSVKVASPTKVKMETSAGYGRTMEFEVFGGYYDQQKVKALFDSDFENRETDFAFCASTSTMPSGRYGHPLAMSAVPAEMTEDGPRLSGENPFGVTLFFSKRTGVIRGTFVLPAEETGDASTVVYAGIALPGWQGSCSECALRDFVQRPWAVGSCSYADRLRKSGMFRNGCLIKLDTYK